MMHARVARVRAPVLISGTFTAEDLRTIEAEFLGLAHKARLMAKEHDDAGEPEAAVPAREDARLYESIAQKAGDAA
ncbi:hypothetical protein [Roseomonas xinghualingensis]|uniref:hypothetical protein n=1 Tax=Roseomonas xinghualingensis TaxID=2986475 RepID=UPI0021F1C86D|nr:hypothetical protein [Roseomonas sp. SXEYE001]